LPLALKELAEFGGEILHRQTVLSHFLRNFSLELRDVAVGRFTDPSQTRPSTPTRHEQRRATRNTVCGDSVDLQVVSEQSGTTTNNHYIISVAFTRRRSGVRFPSAPLLKCAVFAGKTPRLRKVGEIFCLCLTPNCRQPARIAVFYLAQFAQS
jgi:hypothetical protein